jgi:hypothetical protein
MNPDDIIQGTIALQQFAANAKYVEMVVDIAFAVVPSILGLGAAGLIGSAAIRTAKDVMNSISMLQNLGPMIYLGGMTAGQLNRLRKGVAERLKQSDSKLGRGVGHVLTPVQWTKSRLKKGKYTQNKQEEQGGGGGSGNPPPPPDKKTDDKEEEQAKISGIPIDEYVKKKGMP